MATPPRLAKLYNDAQCDYYGDILDRLEAEDKIPEDGVDEGTFWAQLGAKPFMSVERYALHLTAKGIPYRL
jgi:hypothetical protein